MTSPSVPSRRALDGLKELTTDPKVSRAVKDLIEAEYPPGDELYRIFVEHSWAVAHWSRQLAEQLGADSLFVWEAAWLHDIGIKYTHAPGIHCRGEAHYLTHGVLGRGLCDLAGLPAHGLVCERHVGTGFTECEIRENELPLPPRDMLNITLEERIVCYIDQFFSKSTIQPLTQKQVAARIARHGERSFSRYQSFLKEFDSFLPVQLDLQ